MSILGSRGRSDILLDERWRVEAELRDVPRTWLGGPQRRLGAELRRLREQAGLHIDVVSEELERSVSKVSRLETGKGILKTRDVRDLLDRYGVTDQAHRDRLMRWVQDGQRQGWWSDYSDVLDSEDPLLPDNHQYVALEQDARELRGFESTVVPGLLQTEDYARAILNTLSTVGRWGGQRSESVARRSDAAPSGGR